MTTPRFAGLLFAIAVIPAWSFVPVTPSSPKQLLLKSSVSDVDDSTSTPTTVSDLDYVKADLVRCCTRSSTTKPSLDEVKDLVNQIEDGGEQLGIGQASSSSGLISGEWELLYSPEDDTRASPFFWAFRQAFPDSADQIFQITDAIPAPIKEVGPAFQEIDFNDDTNTGSFVSRVKVATLGGMATSEMTTRGSITGAMGYDGLVLKIETTKPEDSTAIKTLFGPLGDFINENAPPFPSGQALEQAMAGSSEVIMRTTFCDETLRISRYEERMDEPFVWKRKEFDSYDML